MERNLKDWVVCVEDELKQMAEKNPAETLPWEKQSIYKVPEYVTNLNKKAYKPQLVSFGPYHHMEPHLEPMEKHKHSALLNFVKRSQKPFQSFIDSMAKVVQSLKDSYGLLDPALKVDSDNFLMMMILDGCFMLEVMRTWKWEKLDYPPNDPIFSKHGKLLALPYIRRDMIMLENQLPILVLSTLLTLEGIEKDVEEHVNNLILKFCFRNHGLQSDLSTGKYLHVLDMYRRSLLTVDLRTRLIVFSEEVNRKTKSGRGTPVGKLRGGDAPVIRPALDLSDAGIRFKRGQDIYFSSNGVLSLPPIVIDNTTESKFLNLIAFERLHVGMGNMASSYIFLMSKLIKSAADVSVLHARGIIQNDLGTNDDVAKLFNSFSHDVTLDHDSYLLVVQERVIRYWKKRQLRVYLMRKYFRSPWAMLSFVTAVVIFIFTLAQTVYTIVPYYFPSKT